MTKIKYLQLKKILSNHFIKFSLVPILVVEITLLILYFSINKYISMQNTEFLLNQAQTHSKELLKKEALIINDKLSIISELSTILQKEHEAIFANPKGFALPNNEPSFAFSDINVFYKTNKIGSSVYYSAKTEITQEERDKAIFTEAMDVSLKNMVDVNDLIVAAYFNSWDGMNRLYPFIDDVSAQYGPHISIQDYNFYYLANKKHNPEKKAVWTSAYLDPAGLGWMLSCIVPIYKNDFLEGVTGIDITIDKFVKNILNQEILYDGKIFIVDKEGMIIAMPEKIEELLDLKELKEHLYTDSILQTIEKSQDFNILKNNSYFSEKFRNLMENKSSFETLNIKDKKYIALSQKVDETDWSLIVLIDKSNILESIEELQNLSNKIGYFAIVFLFLFYIIFFYVLLKKIKFFSEKITQPLVDLSNQSTLVIKNNSEFRKVTTNILEMKQLNDNFIHMIEVLNERSKKLNDAKEYAEKANKSKDEFLANMSHELKTPLNSINIISNIMIKNKLEKFDEKEIENLKIINKCGKNLTYLINDMFDLSKLDAKEIKLENKTINIKNMISNIFKTFEYKTKDRNIKFELILDENLDYMYSDELKIDKILNNLLSNAFKFTKEGNIFLIVEDKNNEIKITVQDEGIGIEKSDFEKIFKRFVQLDSSKSRKYEGTGLGLTICKELVYLLGGKISFKSEKNIGTSFEIILGKNKEFVNIEKMDKPIEDLKIEGFLESNNLDIYSQNNIAKTKDRILILNNDHLLFFNIIIELKKEYEVKQASTLEQLIQFRNEDIYEKIIVDISKLGEKEKEFLISSIDKSFLIIYENEIDDIFSKYTNISIKKPFSKEQIKNYLNKKIPL